MPSFRNRHGTPEYKAFSFSNFEVTTLELPTIELEGMTAPFKTLT